jgi:flagellar biosynthesis protein FlhB
MSTERMILTRRISTFVGVALMLVGMALLDFVLMLTIYGVIALLFGVTFLRARRRSKSRPRPSKAEQIEAVKRFVHKQRRVDIFTAIFLVYLVGVFYWLDGFSATTILVALGGGVLSVERLLVEPRIWAALSRDEGFTLS